MNPETVAVIGDRFVRKKLTEKDKENSRNFEECKSDEMNDVSIVGLYFSAYWCPPCKCFTPILREFYNEINLNEKRFEVVYVPSDHSIDQYKDHY